MRRVLFAIMAALAVSPAASCGLISSDITDFDLAIPKKTFSVDTAQWMISSSVSMSGMVPSIPCPPADCAAAATMFCDNGACTAECVADMTCTAHVPISIRQMFDLATEVDELKTIDEQAVISVTVETIAFEINTNTLNMATPQLTVYMAPQAVTDPSDMRAEPIGIILPIQPLFVGVGQVDLTATGRNSMERFMADFRTPFNIIVAGTADMAAGDPVPQGALAGSVTVTAHAGL